MSFWESDLGSITGNADDAFLKDFTIIPDGTMALARISRFYKVEDEKKKYLAIDWVLVDGDFKGRQVTQKIKVFDNDAKARYRALNMLKLIYMMFKVKPQTPSEPSEQELASFVNKVAGLKIREWSIEKEDGSGLIEGNFVSEVHQSAGFTCETGVKVMVSHVNKQQNLFHESAVESAFSRNSNLGDPGPGLDDLPF